MLLLIVRVDSVPVEFVTAPLPLRAARVWLFPARLRRPLLLRAAADESRSFPPRRVNVPAPMVTLEAPAMPLRVALPPTLSEPDPRLAATVPPLRE